MDDALRRTLDAAFPDRIADGVGSTGPSWNDGNRTVRVAFADDAGPSAAFLDEDLEDLVAWADAELDRRLDRVPR